MTPVGIFVVGASRFSRLNLDFLVYDLITDLKVWCFFNHDHNRRYTYSVVNYLVRWSIHVNAFGRRLMLLHTIQARQAGHCIFNKPSLFL